MSLLDRFRDKTIMLQSDADLDGVGCRVIFEHFIKPICKQCFVYNTDDRGMEYFPYDVAVNCDIIMFTDISPSKEGYLKLIDMRKEVYVFDHHQSAYNELFNVIHENYYYNIEKCGTRVLFDALTEKRRVKKVIAQFVELVDCYDRWQETSLLWKDAKKLHNILYGYVDWFNTSLTETSRHDKFVSRQLEKFETAKVYYFSTYEEGLATKAENKEKENYECAKNNLQIRKDNSNNTYAYFECSSKLSLVANRILKVYQDRINYVICHSTFLEEAKKEINGKVSIRSNGSFDVSIIAEAHGGGGHMNAAGVELPIETFYKVRSGSLHLI